MFQSSFHNMWHFLLLHDHFYVNLIKLYDQIIQFTWTLNKTIGMCLFIKCIKMLEWIDPIMLCTVTFAVRDLNRIRHRLRPSGSKMELTSEILLFLWSLFKTTTGKKHWFCSKYNRTPWYRHKSRFLQRYEAPHQ